MFVILSLFFLQSKRPISAFAFQDRSVLPLIAVSFNSTDLFSITLFVIVIQLLVSSFILAIDAHITDTFYEHTPQLQLIYVFIAKAVLSKLLIAPPQFIFPLRAHDSSLSQSTSLSSSFPL